MLLGVQLNVQGRSSARADCPARSAAATAAVKRETERLMFLGPFLSVVLDHLRNRGGQVRQCCRATAPFASGNIAWWRANFQEQFCPKAPRNKQPGARARGAPHADPGLADSEQLRAGARRTFRSAVPIGCGKLARW